MVILIHIALIRACGLPAIHMTSTIEIRRLNDITSMSGNDKLVPDMIQHQQNVRNMVRAHFVLLGALEE
jgi:hypothetical protein